MQHWLVNGIEEFPTSCPKRPHWTPRIPTGPRHFVPHHHLTADAQEHSQTHLVSSYGSEETQETQRPSDMGIALWEIEQVKSYENILGVQWVRWISIRLYSQINTNSIVLCYTHRSILRIFMNYWLVVYLPLWTIWVRQLGWWHSKYMGSHESHVPNHQVGPPR